MLFQKSITESLKLYAFDTKFDLYDEIMATAIADDRHRLSQSYNHDILSRCVFVTLLALDDEPLAMYGTQLTQWPGVARGFYRFYRSPFARAYSFKQECSQQLYDHTHDLPLAQFYINNTDLLTEYNINSTFATRTFYNRRRDFTFGDRMTNEWGTGFKEHAHIRLFNNTPQRFYVMGDDAFLNDLPVVS